MVSRGGTRARLFLCGALLLVVALTLLASPPALAANPHGAFTSDTDACGSCHVPHDAVGSPIIIAADVRTLCLSCHDGSGSTYDVAAQYDEGTGSAHDGTDGSLSCTECHTPHRGPAEGNPASIAVEGSAATTGSAVCGSCHGTGSALVGGDVVGAIAGSPHDTAAPGDSLAGIGCRACHVQHASVNASLVRTEVLSSSGTTVTVSGEPGLCLACHESSSPAFSGGVVAAAQRHTTVTTSTKALTEWPAASGEPGGCDGCHEPHGVAAGMSYTRDSGDALCKTCHDAASSAYPVNYSYRGGATFAASGHGAITGDPVAYLTVVAEGDEFEVWESATEPEPDSPGSSVPPLRAKALAVRDTTGLLTTAVQETDGDYDYQMYRFRIPAATSDVVSIRMHWEGYGEAAPGFPVVLSVWVPATESWEVLTSEQMVAQTTVNLPLRPADHVAADGTVYLMAKARYAFDERIVTGPTVTALSGTSARVEWVTSGLASSRVDYGPSSSYGSTTGSAALTQNHVVTVTGLTPGVWHFKAVSVAADGAISESTDVEQGIPAPTLTPEPDFGWMGTDPSVTLAWAAPAGAPGGPFSTRLHLLKDGVSYIAPVWGTAATYTSVLGLGTYTWRVEARDDAGRWYGYSAWDTFFIYDNTGTCPYLYTWDGDSYEFEADLYGPGKLGLKTKAGFARPTPDDVYVLAHEPAVIDGLLDLRLVEERFETDYLDQLTMYAIDAPSDRDIYAEKREAGGAAFPGVAGVLHTVAKTMAAPVSAVHVQTGDDVLSLISSDDESYSVLNEDRNTGFDYQTIELDLGDISDAPQVKLVMDAVSMYPSNAEGAARSATFGPRTKLEVQDSSGAWVAVPASVGSLPKAPEFSRPYVFDISNIWVSESRKVRLTFLFKTYVDWIAVDTTADVEVEVTEVPLVAADLSVRGFSGQSSTDEIFEYVYADNTGRTAYLPGAYTRLGDVRELLLGVDDRFVIYGGGDEIALGFQPLDEPRSGMSRRYVVHTNGYYKDLKSDVEHTVDPLPFAAMSNFPYPSTESYPTDAAHTAYRDEWNTRWMGELSPILPAAADEPAPSAWNRLVATLGEWIQSVADVFIQDDASPDPEASAVSTDPLHRSLNTDVVALEVTVQDEPADGQCAICHAPHGGLESGEVLAANRAASDGRTCTGDGLGGCHSSAVNSATGVNVYDQFTSGADARSRHDVMPADQRATGSAIACADCHNPHANSVAATYSDPDDVSISVTSALASSITPAGEVYLLVGAAHDGAGPIISAVNLTVPTPAAYSSPTVSWATNEPASSWIDWGLTGAYELGNESVGTPYGSDTPVTTAASRQIVWAADLTPGLVYHYRVRSTDALGNTTFSTDRTYVPTIPPPSPVMSDETTITGSNNGWPAPLSLTATAVQSNPTTHGVQYQFMINGVPQPTWVTTPSWPTTLYTGTYSAAVRARDAAFPLAVSAWSAPDTFVVESADPPASGSCPFVFSWDGGSFAYENEIYTTGKLAAPRANGTFQKPNPNDYCVLDTALQPKDGKLEIRLVEEIYETDYLDEFKLYAVDVPNGMSVAAEKIPQGGSFAPLEEVVHSVSSDPVSVPAVHVQTGDSVTAELAASDNVYVTLSEDKELPAYQTIELDLGDLTDANAIKLLFEGATRFPRTEAGKLLGTAGVRQKVEVIGSNGEWVTLPGEWPKPAEFERTYMLDLTGKFPTDDYRVRLTFLLKTYVDTVLLDTSADTPLSVTELALDSAVLGRHGRDGRSNDGDVYEYVYGEDNDFTGYFPGNYTRFGDVAPLLEATDDMFAIFGGGDELVLRFDPPADVPEGMTRKYVLYANGYYKDLYSEVPKTVGPLPFASMSNYPYGVGEQYPDDQAHLEYLAQWNTRVEEAVVAPVTPAAGDVTWRTYHAAAWVTAAALDDSPSVASDYAVLRTEDTAGASTIFNVAAGWESQSIESIKPMPWTPGIPVPTTDLDVLGSDDNTDYWATALATTDSTWNWQLMRFDLGSTELSDLRSVQLSWNGRGEPTPGYQTAVYYFNPQSSEWVLIQKAMMAADTAVNARMSATLDGFCLKCHDGAPPAGVVFPAGVTNVGASWAATTGDFHGGRAGSGFGGTLAEPYTRGQASIPCATCHDTHGNANIYHFESPINGNAVGPVTTGNWTAVCQSCHVGTVRQMHEGCAQACHYGEADHYDDITGLLPTEASDCSRCHGHGKAWRHNLTACGHCHIDITYPRTF